MSISLNRGMLKPKTLKGGRIYDMKQAVQILLPKFVDCFGIWVKTVFQAVSGLSQREHRRRKVKNIGGAKV